MSIGIDMVYIPRVRDKENLAKRVLCPEELAVYYQRQDKDKYLAGRFAAKEAFFKAMQGKLEAVPFKAVKTLNLPSGLPILTYQGKNYPVSISHDGDYAVAIVQIEE